MSLRDEIKEQAGNNFEMIASNLWTILLEKIEKESKLGRDSVTIDCKEFDMFGKLRCRMLARLHICGFETFQMMNLVCIKWH